MEKTLARVFGVIIALIGVVGLFSNSLIGTSGYFQANVGLDIVNFVLGVVLLFASAKEAQAALWLKIVGVVYFILAIFGFALMGASGVSNVFGFMQFNMADNWLYGILGLIVFIAGFARNSTMMVAATHAHS